MIYEVCAIFSAIADTAMLIWFIPGFMKRDFRQGRRWALVFPIMFFVCMLISSHLIRGAALFEAIVTVMAALCFSLALCGGRYSSAAVISVCYIIVRLLCSGTIFALMSLDSILVRIVLNPWAFIALIISGKVIQFIILRLVFLFFGGADGIDGRSGVIILTYSLTAAIGLCALILIAVRAKDDSVRLPVVVLLLVMNATFFIIWFMLRQSALSARKEYEYKLMKAKMETERMRAEDADAIWENIRRARHDMKNHFTVIKGSLQEGDIAGCEQYIDKIYPQIDNIGNLVHTGNVMVDYLINTKFSMDKGIQIIATGAVELFDDIDGPDMASLFGNLLDNAFEAVEKLPEGEEKRIDIQFGKSNNSRIIVCKNTVAAPVLATNSELISDKKDGDHGLGHRIVASVAEKYGGFAEYADGEGTFSAQIILPLKN